MTEEYAEWLREGEAAKQNKPVRSDIRERTLSSRYWCCLLDGRPVAHCSAFDTEEGWVRVYVISEKRGPASIRTDRQVLLYGAVEPVWIEEFSRLSQQIPPIEVWEFKE
jgi:hypothetical protein